MDKILDYRSDTVTQATPAMRQAMMQAEVGDDILGEDPTVKRLESVGAAMFGKQAGLFVISGTMANQVAVMALTQRGDEVLVGEESHIYNLEVGGLAALSGVQARTLRATEGRFDVRSVKAAIRPSGIQTAVTRLLCLENTYDLNRGIPLPPEYMEQMCELAHEAGLTVYLDGARVFNAAAVLGVDSRTLCAPVDAMQVCLSKGLAAPVGSLLLGSTEFITKARWIRQRLGGGMRQAGHMAAAGLVAMETMTERLVEDHENARMLAEGLAAIDERLVDLTIPMTNVVQIEFGPLGLCSEEVVSRLLNRGVKVKPIGPTACRMITHWGISKQDIEETLAIMQEMLTS
ncbi:threonine aldolase [Anaerosporomusa subterranea]|uniref:Threonine aldolase n=1 Tax=Anaerosporomusa subterranea TaxID=1794912 RepID=A0A154BV86_ANASB|nr:GntG family PLP-dependent aldolase [Anaerosporomusa subterranea]KYZ77817.1 threonine aldolase [Anaerosporomusa subterranea]